MDSVYPKQSCKLKTLVVFLRLISDNIGLRNFGRIYIYIYIYIFIYIYIYLYIFIYIYIFIFI